MAPFGRDSTDESDESNTWGVEDADRQDDGSGATRDEDPLSLADVSVVDDDPHGTLKRAVDREAGVVVYAYKNGNAGGVTAVPISETELSLGED